MREQREIQLNAFPVLNLLAREVAWADIAEEMDREEETDQRWSPAPVTLRLLSTRSV